MPSVRIHADSRTVFPASGAASITCITVPYGSGPMRLMRMLCVPLIFRPLSSAKS